MWCPEINLFDKKTLWTVKIVFPFPLFSPRISGRDSCKGGRPVTPHFGNDVIKYLIMSQASLAFASKCEQKENFGIGRKRRKSKP